MTRYAAWKVATVVAVMLFSSAACSESVEPGTTPTDGEASSEEIDVQMASYDVVAGERARLLVGLITKDQLFISHGEIDMEFFYGGTEETGKVELGPGPKAVGSFLPVEGHETTAGPVAGPASEGRGVYAAEVRLPKPGFWVVQATAESLEGTTYVGNTSFQVGEEHSVPAVGERAPAVENLTLESIDAPPAAIDSRASAGTEVPDPELHQTTVASSLANNRPVLVLISTPTYCVSRFCGPITDMVSDLQRKYQREADFIHIEVWRDFEDQVVNKAAAGFIYRDRKGALTEPWIFLVDAEGRIEARWDNVATPSEIEPFLKSLSREAG